MKRFVAIMIALLFATGAPSAPAWAQAKKETPAKTEPKGDAKPAKSDAEKPGEKKGGKLDINTASLDELKAVPGIGDAYAKKIVDNRPYTRKDELVKKNIIPQATYDKVKDQIIAHRVKDTKAEIKKDAADTKSTKPTK
jgi:DNA uptake protein ComE-like DNA-binding protein